MNKFDNDVVFSSQAKQDLYFEKLLQLASDDIDREHIENAIEKLKKITDLANKSPFPLSDIQKKSIHNIVKLCLKINEQNSDIDPIQTSFIRSDLKALIEILDGVDDFSTEAERTRKKTLLEGDENFRSLLNDLREDLCTPDEAVEKLNEFKKISKNIF